ncbi:MAG: 6-pyruvoyl-tetrahydropterin synthase-related protein [Anaerolineae bacterium]
MSRIRSWLPWFSLILLVLLAIQPLLGDLPKGHDTLLHVYRIPQISALWAQGIPFSRWAPDLAYGYGYPLLNFYPPLSPYLLTTLNWLINQNAVLATSLSFTLAVTLGCLGMYILGSSVYRRWGGVLAAAAYTLAPHYIYQTYERGSLSTALVVALFPWALWAVLQVSRKPTLKRAALAAIAILLVFASHASASMLFLPIPVILGLISAVKSSANQRERLLRVGAVAASIALGMALSAWIWLPSLAELPLSQYGQSVSSGKQLYLTGFADILRWPGTVVAGEINPPLSQSPGLAQLGLAFVAMVISTITLIHKCQVRETDTLTAWISLVSALLGLTFAFFATRYSLLFWQHLPFLYILQYPWRFLDTATICLALACGSLTASFRIRLGQVALIAASLVVFTANAIPYLYPPRWVELPLHPTLADATAAQQKYGIFGLTSWGEYLPATASWRVNQPAFAGADEGASLADKLDRSDPQLDVIEQSSNSLHAELRITLKNSSTLTFATYYFPGWFATLDGAALPARADANGLISIKVPAGEHLLTLAFGETPLRLAADIISVLALLGVLVALLKRPKRPEYMVAKQADRVGSYPACAWLVPAVLIALLVSKVLYFDRFDSPLVVHLYDNKLMAMSTEAVWASPEINLAGSKLNSSELALFWQAQIPTAINYEVQVSLVDKLGTVGAQVTRQHPGYYPTSYWESGQLVRDSYILPLENLPHSGSYQVMVTLQTPLSPTLAASNAISLCVGTIIISPTVIVDKLRVRFGDAIALDAVEFPASIAAGQMISMTLLWRSLETLDQDYTVMIHLLRLDGSLEVAGDAAPLQDTYPTSIWAVGQTFRDEHLFYAPVEPGLYEVEVGWYLASSGDRLEPEGPGTTNTARVMLGPIEVTEPTN